ncbi:leucine-rich repeat-containing protein 18 [Anguilla rostrata]|uniref:leucine-rich repeat-containing protein 18 n=1 Tax=Anguilla rostrata TaxID=7938 RepID=UPI0030CAAAFD
MAVGKKKGAKVRITLKIAKKSVSLTADGMRRLDLSKRGIDTFPKCLLKMADVDELDLSRNLLQKLPESIEHFANLRCLDLHSNRLERLPEAIGRLQNLRHLNLCDNRLGPAVPAELGALRALRSLNLGMNRIETLPRAPFFQGLAELRKLGLFDNLLAEPPEAARSLPRVRRLNAERNPFSLVAPGDGGDRARDELPRLYLRGEGDLCGACQRRSRERWGGRNPGGGSGPPNGRPRFSGLSTPNSVARETQGRWRVRNSGATETPEAT